MEIGVLQITASGATRTISFVQPIRQSGDERVTGVGARAMRILTQHLTPAREIWLDDTHSIGMDYPVTLPTIHTVAAMQREMDRYANAKITIDFKTPRVLGFGTEAELKDNEAVTRWRCIGKYVQVAQTLELSLPAHLCDVVRIKKFVPGDVWIPRRQPKLLELRVLMDGARAQQNPWDFIVGLRPQITRAIS